MDQNNFDQKVSKDKHYVIEFYSKNCYWCERLASDYGKLAEHYNSENAPRHDVVIAKVNAPENMILGYKFHIMSYPTIVLVRKGEMGRAFLFGFDRTYDNIKNWIEETAGPEEIIQVQQSQDNSDTQGLDEPPVADNFLQVGSSQDQSDNVNVPVPDSNDNKPNQVIDDIVGTIQDQDDIQLQTSLGDCQQESLQSIYDQYLYAISQKKTHDNDISLIKEKLLAQLNETPASGLFRDVLFFFFGISIGSVLFLTYKKLSAVSSSYKD